MLVGRITGVLQAYYRRITGVLQQNFVEATPTQAKHENPKITKTRGHLIASDENLQNAVERGRCVDDVTFLTRNKMGLNGAKLGLNGAKLGLNGAKLGLNGAKLGLNGAKMTWHAPMNSIASMLSSPPAK